MLILNVITDKRRAKLHGIADTLARREQIKKYIIAECAHAKCKIDNAVIIREVLRLDNVIMQGR